MSFGGIVDVHALKPLAEKITGMVGPYGYWADLSCAFPTGPARPRDEQRRLYRRAYEQVLTSFPFDDRLLPHEI